MYYNQSRALSIWWTDSNKGIINIDSVGTKENFIIENNKVIFNSKYPPAFYKTLLGVVLREYKRRTIK